MNASPAPLSNLAFEFPGGSFGVDTIAPGGMREKWFKPTSTGALKVEFDDRSGHHSVQLAKFEPDESGIVRLTFSGDGRVEVAYPPFH